MFFSLFGNEQNSTVFSGRKDKVEIIAFSSDPKTSSCSFLEKITTITASNHLKIDHQPIPIPDIESIEGKNAEGNGMQFGVFDDAEKDAYSECFPDSTDFVATESDDIFTTTATYSQSKKKTAAKIEKQMNELKNIQKHKNK